MNHPAFASNHVAVVTGAASGIGLAAAQRFAGLGMNVVLADLPGKRLDTAARETAALSPHGLDSVAAIAADVASIESLQALERDVVALFGRVHVLMNNAGIPGSSMFGAQDAWEKVFAVNLWGVINGSRIFAPGMIAHGQTGLIINTGSKQGITTPPGDPAYNVTKAGVKAFTEALQHELRNTPDCRITAHLLIPGFVYTALTAQGRTEKPQGAWTPQETVDFMMQSLENDDFYILCPDNDVERATDEKRILWAAGDIIENRPPLSRWHPDYADAFKAFLTKDRPKIG
ncbi:SDR family NAD(P)-dependent oxidoreductase [Rhizobium giardinii]|jgi:NAD(P)-dependent dehydrogenase (short-subunit alcohol dehydrogenase family)|uniref:NAD(P)-dependent dehydrogenase (Short-subunit alcohol dehydrogenase family) n=1 Tax=Rhizobium giardinii TaxID=56731 RepID=A0A7W8U7X3_9HYPH|nr:SDR family NAD(P)-dependent oxidoreductase [Rhizobium giardinii]MBB5534475.1 NAD(P)-dependent dehydrogenase (short-subunit alcohol dehydrogenase family) [Rhizobium giardinii]